MYKTQLFVRLTPGSLTPTVGCSEINVFRSGPETLLRWLEMQLGLPTLDSHKASHILEYATALDTVKNSAISGSIETDRWATATELLSRRDELQLWGWNHEDSELLPNLVRDLAYAAKDNSFVFLSVADRLKRVLTALDSGQQLPAHECTLSEATDA